MMSESTYQSGYFTDIPAYSLVKATENTFMDLFYERMHLWLFCNLFEVFNQLVFKCSIN